MLIREFNKFNDAFCTCKWYYFSLEMQKMLLIVVANTQQPIFIQGFGNIPCTRDSFKKVSNQNDEEVLWEMFEWFHVEAKL